jgi:hypothetical protein
LLAELLLGRIIGNHPPSPELIDSLPLRHGKESFMVCPRGGFLDFPRIISQSSLTMVTFKGVVDLKALKGDLKRWNEAVFGNVKGKKKILLEEIRVFDIIEKERALGVEERMKKAEVVSELERSTLMEEVSWR